jgi:hypothetical protein
MGDEKVVMNTKPFAVAEYVEYGIFTEGILGLARQSNNSLSFIQAVLHELDNPILVLSFDE